MPSNNEKLIADQAGNGEYLPLVGIIRHSEAMGGISRITFQMNAAPALREEFADTIEA